MGITPEILLEAQGLAALVPPEEIEARVLTLEQERCPVFHTFGPGVYVRELHAPQGALLLGHKQNYEHLNVFMQGAVTVFDSDGNDLELVAPMTFTGKPGRKFGIITEDMIWLNIFATEETDLEDLENMLFEKSDTWKNLTEPEEDPREHGYGGLLAELGIARDQMDLESQPGDLDTGLPYGTYKCGIHRSRIHGKGLMATADINKDECIGPVVKNGYRTPFGRRVNHSDRPNTRPVRAGKDINLFALQDLSGNHGGILGDEILIDYREVVNPRR